MAQHLTIQMSEDGADAERLDLLTSHLRRELDDVDDAEVASLVTSGVPEGARAVDAVAVGGLVVSLFSSDALRSVVAAVQHWLHRGQPASRAVHLEIGGDVIDLSAASAADQERLIQAFMARHAASSGSP